VPGGTGVGGTLSAFANRRFLLAGLDGTPVQPPRLLRGGQIMRQRRAQRANHACIIYSFFLLGPLPKYE